MYKNLSKYIVYLFTRNNDKILLKVTVLVREKFELNLKKYQNFLASK